MKYGKAERWHLPYCLAVPTTLLLLSAIWCVVAVAQTAPRTPATVDPGMQERVHSARLQPNRFVSGRIQMVDCQVPVTALTLEIREFFYVRNGNSLEIPMSRGRRDSRPSYDRLRDGGSDLEQGRVVARGRVGTDGRFRVEWYSPPFRIGSVNVPWIENVQRTGAGDTTVVSVYRVLSPYLQIDAPPPPPTAFWLSSFVTEPMITFFGTETSKDLGVLGTKCYGADF